MFAPRIFYYHRGASASIAEMLVSSYFWMKFVINQRERRSVNTIKYT